MAMFKTSKVYRLVPKKTHRVNYLEDLNYNIHIAYRHLKDMIYKAGQSLI